jgi:uncharacterized protein YciI
MSQYIVVAKDGTDHQALERRMKARPAHIELMQKYKTEGKFVSGGAMLDKDGKMIGSVVTMDFATEEEIKIWISEEPYILGNVWQQYEIHPFRYAAI